jgi:hypothetical protein
MSLGKPLNIIVTVKFVRHFSYHSVGICLAFATGIYGFIALIAF